MRWLAGLVVAAFVAGCGDDVPSPGADADADAGLAIVAPAAPAAVTMTPCRRLEYFDNTFKLVDDLYRSEELNILGVVGNIKGTNYSQKLITSLEIFSPVIESYRRVRSKIRLSFIDRSMKTFLVTSPMQGEGKSLTVANLGISLAQGGLKTILLDADLRRPVLHDIFVLNNEPGLTDLLHTRETKFDHYLQETKVSGLCLLASGKSLQDPPERFSSGRMNQILRGLEKIADVVIIDSPPALVVADAMVLSSQVDGVILVIQSGRSKWSAIRQTLYDFQKARANYLGSIINKVPKSITYTVYEISARARVAKLGKPPFVSL